MYLPLGYINVRWSWLSIQTGYWWIFIYVYIPGCVKCHVYFSTFVFANENWFFFCRVLSFIIYCDQSNRVWRWRNVNCERFIGRRARIPWWWRRLITVSVLMWPPNAKLPRSAPAVVWWKSFFVTPYRRSCKGLAPTKLFISGQPHFGHNCFWGGGVTVWGCFWIWAGPLSASFCEVYLHVDDQ
jgi:hypothetical protein